MKFTYFAAIAMTLFGMGMAAAVPSVEVVPVPDGEVRCIQLDLL